MSRVENLEDDQRVVITGLGTVNPSGLNVQDSFKRWLEGKSAITPTKIGYPGDYTTELAGRIRFFRPGLYLGLKQQEKTSDMALYSLAATIQAAKDSRFLEQLSPATKYKDATYRLIEGIKEDRIAVIVGAAVGGANAASTARFTMAKYHNPNKVDINTIKYLDSNEISAVPARYLGVTGGEYTPFNACAAGAMTAKLAWQEIVTDQADLVVAGGADASLMEAGFRGFQRWGANVQYDNYQENPALASKPFDKKAQGFVIGEGSGIIIFERLSHALSRKAKSYAELIGFGFGSFAKEPIKPTSASEAIVMRRALAMAELSPEMIDYINAHAAGTTMGDPQEGEAIKEVFGSHAKDMPVSSTKSMIGHLMGAAGGVETIATIKSVQTNLVHPSINIEEPVVDGVYFPSKAVSRVIKYAMVNSFGLNGTYFCAIYGKYREKYPGI